MFRMKMNLFTLLFHFEIFQRLIVVKSHFANKIPRNGAVTVLL